MALTYKPLRPPQTVRAVPGAYGSPSRFEPTPRGFGPPMPASLLGGLGGARTPLHSATGHAYSIADYLRSLGYGSSNAYLNSLGLTVPGYSPLSDAAAQSQSQAWVNSQLGPLLDRLKGDYAERSKQGAAAIQGLTTMLAGLASQFGPTEGAAYNEAIGQDKALAGALADRLTASGKASGNELGAALAQAGQDTAPAGEVTGVGAAAGSAGFAMDSAAIEALIAHAAAAKEYGAKLPFIEGMTGVQAGREFEGQLANAYGQDVSDIMGRAPDLASSFLANLYAKDQTAQARHDAAVQNRASALMGLNQDYVSERQRKQDLTLQTKQRGQDIAYRNKRNAIDDARYRARIVGANAPTVAGQRAYWDAQAAKRQASDPQRRIWVGTPSGMKPIGISDAGRAVVAPDAPTAAGRKAYWQGQVDEQTSKGKAHEGEIWIATPKGMQPVIDKRTGQPKHTLEWIDHRNAVIVNSAPIVNGKRVLTPAMRKEWKANNGYDPGRTPPGTTPVAPKAPKPPTYKEVKAGGKVWMINENNPKDRYPVGVVTTNPSTSVKTQKINGRVFQYDPTTKTWSPAAGLPKDTTAAAKAKTAPNAFTANQTKYLPRVQSDAQRYVDANPGWKMSDPEWAKAYNVLINKYQPLFLAGVKPQNRNSVVVWLNHKIGAFLGGASTRPPSSSSPSGAPKVVKH